MLTSYRHCPFLPSSHFRRSIPEASTIHSIDGVAPNLSIGSRFGAITSHHSMPNFGIIDSSMSNKHPHNIVVHSSACIIDWHHTIPYVLVYLDLGKIRTFHYSFDVDLAMNVNGHVDYFWIWEFEEMASKPLLVHKYQLVPKYLPPRSHVYYMSGDAWKEGGIDATGALMVLTLKVISCSINYNDGLLKEEELREAQKKNRLIKLPSLIEYCGYCLCCGSHFAGPVYEVKDYLEWTERKGGGPSLSPYGATIRALLQAAFCMALYLYLVPHFPLSRFTDPLYQEWGFWKRLSYQYMSGFTARWKYYFIWSISEASIIISGLGFSGWTDTSPPKPRWDRAKMLTF
ncbi:hypothetical protein GH714_002033 [Hevea brasiliensis]|uniref:Uncharacterized protein n=1 Tax=Hevea brasiliensis TaxID=3981 RepID=A0A6A6LC44_HEVBR|nr:hypothetical protein GH714_002033 [Hevea brasiliensis]